MELPKGCSFQYLPFEVRSQIYESLVVTNELLYVNSGWPRPANLINAFSILAQGEVDEILRLYYRHNKFRYLFTNLESGTFDYKGLIERLEELPLSQRRSINQVVIVTFFSTPERVAVAKEALAKWFAEQDRGFRDDVLHFDEKYWCWKWN